MSSHEEEMLKHFTPKEGDIVVDIEAAFDIVLFLKEQEKNTSAFIEVNCNRIDNLISNIEKINEVNWIKIDVEGAELEVLKGATNVLSKSKDIALLIEIHNISEGRNLYKNIMDLLKNYNFKIEFEKVYENRQNNHSIINYEFNKILVIL